MSELGDIFAGMREERRDRAREAKDKARRELRSSSAVSYVWRDDHHVQAIRGGKVVAQWWPSRGKTMSGAARGRRCKSAADFERMVAEIGGAT